MTARVTVRTIHLRCVGTIDRAPEISGRPAPCSKVRSPLQEERPQRAWLGCMIHKVLAFGAAAPLRFETGVGRDLIMPVSNLQAEKHMLHR